MKTYPVHNDYRKLHVSLPFYAWTLPLLQRLTRITYERQAIPDSIEKQKTTIAGPDGHAIPIEIFSPTILDTKAPCLLFIHGGAFALPATHYHKRLMVDYALGCRCKVIFVDYRLVPRYPYPCGLEDCFATYAWIVEHGDEMRIDTNRIGICGDSAGGALAAALTHMIRDRSFARPLFHMLVYPVLDASLGTDSMKRFSDTPIWHAKLNKKMWNLYLSDHPDTEDDPYASPAGAISFEGLPAGYIEVNEFDCLRDEARAYFEKLHRSGIDTILIQTEGTIHGFELNYSSAYTQDIIRKRIEYMKGRFT